MENSKNIQETIKKYLSDNGKNAVDLAKDLKVSKTTTSRWINGKAKEIRNSHWKLLREKIPALDTPSFNLSVDEAMLLKAYRKFSDSEKETAVEEFTVKAAYKTAQKTG